MMDILNFDYELPENSIAQTPVEPRDHSRLLVANREKQSIEHKYFFDIVDYLNPGDILVVNDTKVIAARLNGEKSVTGGKVEILLTKKMDVKYSNEWEAMVRPSKRIPEGTKIIFPDTEGFYLTVEESLSEGLRRVVLSTKQAICHSPPTLKIEPQHRSVIKLYMPQNQEALLHQQQGFILLNPFLIK